MRISPNKYLLYNLEGRFSEETSAYFLPKEKAYEALKKYTGQDFGYDVKAWKRWFRQNREKKRKAYERLLLANLIGAIPVGTKGRYLPKEEAHERLKLYSGQDFGYDTAAWKAWFAKQRK
jgi:hypothetical protein